MASRPTDEHVHIADLAIERAKRLVEDGRNVGVLVDGITRLPGLCDGTPSRTRCCRAVSMPPP